MEPLEPWLNPQLDNDTFSLEKVSINTGLGRYCSGLCLHCLHTAQSHGQPCTINLCSSCVLGTVLLNV